MAPAPRPDRPTSHLYLWLVVLGVALLVGAAAALLSGAAGANGPGSSSNSPGVATYVAWAIVAIGLAYLGATIYDRVRNGSMPVPTRIVVTILVVIALLIGFVLLSHFVATTQWGTGTSPSPGSGNQNQSLPFNDSQNSTGNFTAAAPSVNVPAWAFYALIAVVAAIVGLAAMRVALRTRDPELPDTDRDAVRAALRTAFDALDSDTADPREVLIALYAQLLVRLAPVAQDLDTSTAEEIRRDHLVRLGVRARSAAEITRLFELARYSSHPIGSDDAQRARAAFREALDDLDRAGKRP